MIIKSIASSSMGNCLYLSNGVSHLLLEAGVSLKKLREKDIDLVQLDGCLITHHHGDHAKYTKEITGYTKVYSSKETLEKVPKGRWSFNEIAVEAKKPFEIGTFKITAFDGYHENSDGTPCKVFMYLIYSKPTKEYIFFATDTAILPKINIPIDYLIIEMNYSKTILQNGRETFESALTKHEYERLRKSHLGLETVIDWMKNDLNTKKLKEIYLMHLSDRNSDEKLFKSEVQKATGSMVFVCEK